MFMKKQEPEKPRKNGGRISRDTYPWETTEIGKSFSVGRYSRSHLNRIANRCSKWGQKLDKKFSCRKADTLTHHPNKKPFYELHVWRDE